MSDGSGEEGLKVGLPPVARPDSRLFILGSLPGDASLAARKYYAHPRNHFWSLLGLAIDEDLQSLTYEQRLERLAQRKIGLWDVVASAVRRGSLDQAIRSPGHNRIEQLVRDYPDLQAIAFNGSTASAVGHKLIGRPEGVELIDLPSSSPANTRPLAEKAAAWVRIGQFAGAQPLRDAQFGPRW